MAISYTGQVKSKLPTLVNSSGTSTSTSTGSTNSGSSWSVNNQPTAMQIYEQIGKIYQQDQEQAYKLLNDFRVLQDTKGSPYWNPYTQATNKAVQSIGQYGIDTSNIDDKWYDDNQWLMGYYLNNGNTNAASKPGKKATATQLAAYDFNLINDARKDTENALREWEEMQNEARYWTTATDRNYTDQEIVDKVMKDYEKKYPTLAKMDSTRLKGEPMNLNSAVGYSDAALYGTIWNARNGDKVDNPETAIVMSALGTGKQYQENAKLRAKLNETDKSTYSPYSVGSTMENERVMFGVQNFSWKWVEQNRAAIEARGNDKEIAAFNRVVDALNYTDELTKQRNALYAQIDKQYDKHLDKPEEWLDKVLSSGNYDDLLALDETITGDKITELKGTAYAVDYRKQDAMNYLMGKVNEAKSGKTLGQKSGVTTSATDAAIEQEKDRNLNSAGPVIDDFGTAENKLAFETGRSGQFSAVVGSLISGGVALLPVSMHNAGQNLTEKTAKDYLGNVRTIYAYDQEKNKLESAQKSLEELNKKIEPLQIRYNATNGADEYTSEMINALEQSRDAEYYKEVMKGDDDDAKWEVIGQLFDIAYPEDNFSDAARKLFGGTIHETDTPEQFLAAYPRINQALDMFMEGIPENTSGEKPLTEEEAKNLRMYTARAEELQKQINDETDWLEEHQTEYDAASNDQDRLANLWATGAAMYSANGETLDSSIMANIENLYAMSQNYVPTNFTSASVWDMALSEGKMSKEDVYSNAKGTASQNVKSAKQIRDYMAYMESLGVTFTDEEKRNLESQIRDLDENGKAASYVLLDEASDFDARVNDGKKILESRGLNTTEGIFWNRLTSNPGNMFDAYSIALGGPASAIGNFVMKGAIDALDYLGMTQDEINRYAYLVSLDFENGTDEAQKYIDFMMNDTNGALRVRGDETRRQEIRDMANSSGWANLAMYGASLASNFAQTGFELSDKANRWVLGKGEGYNGYNFLARAVTEESRQAAQERLYGLYATDAETGKIDPKKKETVDFWFGAMTSALDSLVNSAVFGSVGEAAGAGFSALGKKLGDWAGKTKWGKTILSIADKADDTVLGHIALEGGKKIGGFGIKAVKDFSSAAYMGANASLTTYRENILAGVPPEQAAQLAWVSFLAETVTEAVTMENIGDAFHAGETGAVKGIRDFVTRLVKDGLEESVGEGFGAWWEANAERVILGEYSQYEQNVQNYLDSGYPETVARQLADQEMWKGVMNEAMSAFVSAGFSTTGATVVGIANGSNKYLRQQEEMRNRQKEFENTVQPDTFGEQNTNFRNQSVTPASQETQAVWDLAKDLTLMFETQTTGDKTKSSANIGATLYAGGITGSISAAQHLVGDIANGDNYVAGGVVAGLLQNANGTNLDVKQNIVWAANTQGTANEVLKGIAQKVANNVSLTNQDVSDLQAAVKADQNGDQADTLRSQFAATVRENMISNGMNELIASSPEAVAKMESLKLKEAALETATSKLELAKQQLKKAQEQNDANAENLRAMASDISKNLPEKEDSAARAARQQARLKAISDAKSAVQIEQQNVKQSQDAVNKAKREYNDAAQKTINEIREQATVNADQQIKTEQEAAEQQAKEQALAKAEEDLRSGKTEEERTSALIEDLLNRDQLEGEEREAQKKKYEEMAEKIKLRKIDMSNLMNNAEGYLAMMKLERKLGIKVDFSNDLGNARGKYENGVVYLNQNLIKNGKMTIGQAVIEACLHEFTHSAENTGWYKQYADVVLHDLFRGENGEIDQAALKAAVAQKIADYKRLQDVDLDDTGATKEIVADYARTHLNSKDVVNRLCLEGLGGKIKNALHNINQAIKNYNLQGEEKVTAEYLRRAERMFQKTLDEVSKTTVHPEGGQFSVMQMAQATGMRFDEKTRTLYDRAGNVVDGITNKITADMVDAMPVGMLITTGLSNESSTDEQGNYVPSQQEAAKEMMAGLMNMIARYKDSDLIWEIGATTLNSTFSAIKSNSDPQYKTTVDFGTVCAKTQAIVDVMSRVMKDKIDPETGMLKEGASRGLTRNEVMLVYNEVHKAGLSVPCPVCYVFSRWMGVPSLLGQMSQYQHDFVVTQKDANGKTVKDKNGNAVIDKVETQKNVDKYIKQALADYGDAKTINKRKATLQGNLTKLVNKEEALTKQLRDASLTNEERANIKKQIKELWVKEDEVNDELGKVSAYNWVTQALCKETSKGSEKYVVDDKFKLTPDEILFDLNKTGEFAGYEKNWTYRNTRGAGMGKAIMPYSGETIGDILYGVNSSNKGRRQSNIKNPWLNMDAKSAARQLRNAIDRAKKQNLVGGQRLQSTSDFRPEWGLDYIMSFLELQAAKSKVQMYTKVADAVDFFASVGADVNLSIMGQGNGFHEASAEEIAAMTPEEREASTVDGKTYVMDFSNITGMKYYSDENGMGALDYKNKYDNVQMILVGMNDTHIRLAMKNADIDFIIPWHSSGNSKDVLAGLISAVGEKLKASVDYTTTQSDMVKGSKKSYYDENGKKVEYTAPGKQTETEKALWDARVKLLTKGGNSLTQAEREKLLSNPYTRSLYYRFTLKKGQSDTFDGVTYTYDPECSGVKLSADQAKQIFPYEYWDKTSTRENADVNGQRFVEYCDAMGIVPRFSQFKDDPGYWKLLIDRSMYANNTYNDDGTVKEYGKYRDQRVIDVTKARIGALNDNAKLENSDLPTQAQAKYAPKDPRSPNYEKYNAMEDAATENALSAVEEERRFNARSAVEPDQYDDGSEGQFSVYGDVTLADMEQMMQADNDYMDAVDRGDMDAAAKDVEDYAYGRGYTDRVYHGTNSYGFTEFNMQKGKGVIFASYKNDLAGTYATEEGSGVYNLFAKPGNQLVLDAEYHDWDDVPIWWNEDYPLATATTREIADYAKRNGYDSVRINNVVDNGSESDVSGLTDIGIFFNQNDVKSADTVTYDDNGNVIPLSERFSGNPDIRYSVGGELTLADMEQALLDSGAITEEELANYRGETGGPGLPPGNGTDLGNPAIDTGSRQRQFGRVGGTASTSDALHQEVKNYLYRNSSYTPDTNQAQIDRAVGWVQDHATTDDPEGYYGALDEVTRDDFDYRSADGQAKMLTVMSMAALKAQNGETVDVRRAALNDELRLADAYNKQGTDLGRMLQARKIFRLMTPLGRQSVLRSMMDKANEEFANRGKNTRINLSEWTMRAAEVAQTEEEFDEVRRAAAKEIAEQLPSNWKDKLRGWRMLSMLGNPRTHGRNFIGNALFIPAVSIKNKMAAAMELGLGKGNRTKTLSPVLSKEIRNFARQDAVTMKDMLTGEAKYNESDIVEQERKPFKGFLQSLIDFNSKALEGEDWFFLKGHYRRALGGWMQANGYTVEDMQKNPGLLEKGRTYAIEEAQKATYRDFNGVAKRLNDLTRNPETTGQKILGLGVDAVLPFKKTPANILKRGLEYSPIGMARSIYNLFTHMKQYNDFQNGKLSVMPKKAMSPNQVIDQFCSGLTGTAILAMGAFLSSLGAVSVGFGDDDDEYEKAKGNQEYALKVRLFGHDVTETLDWAAPMSMPFFVGAAIQKQFEKEGELNLNKLANAFGNISEPLFNLSMLDGVNSLLKVTQSGDDANTTITQIAAKVAANYISSYVPSAVGALARTIDDTQRKSYVESGKSTGLEGTKNYLIEQLENKIPFLSQTNIPVRDARGNPKTSGLVERILENWILPGYHNEYHEDAAIDEMQRLYHSTGEHSMVLDEDPDKTITIGKTQSNIGNPRKIILTDKEWDQYKEVRNSTAFDMIDRMILTGEYQNADDATQVEMIKGAWKYGNQTGIKAVADDYIMDSYGANPMQTIMNDAIVSTGMNEMIKALEAQDYETYETVTERMRQAGADDQSIKNKIANTYRDQYKTAYLNDDTDRMYEIEDVLDSTEFSFDYKKWRKDADKKQEED